MKLIIWWLTTMVLLPLIYLFWWKKRWRLLLGVSILAITAIGIFSPGEITYSILASELEKETKTKEKKIDAILNKAANEKIDGGNEEKIKNAQKIIEFDKKLRELKKSIDKERDEKKKYFYYSLWTTSKVNRDQVIKEWMDKWNQEKFLSALLFCGEEFSNKLTSREYKIGQKETKSKIATENVIDLANYRDSKPEEVKEKILKIIKKVEEEKMENASEEFSIVLFKNIDKITKPELENLLLKVFDPQTDADFWKYKDKNNTEITPDLLRLVLVVTTSTSNPKISNDLQKKLRHVEPTIDKYFWTFFLSSAATTAIILMILIRKKRKSDNKALKNLN